MITSLHKGLVLSALITSAILAIGGAGSAYAQSSSNNGTADNSLARCQQLYGAWSKYNAGSSYSPQLQVDAAYDQCRQGNVAGGVAGLTQALQRAKIPVPPVESANSP